MLGYHCGSINTNTTTKDGEHRYKQFFSKLGCEKIFKTKDRQYINRLLSSTLKVFPDARDGKLPKIGSISPNIAPIEKPEKQAAKNMKT